MLEALPLSVIVSTHDSERTLREALAAIREIELPRESYEIIVVDDASSDASVAIAARYADTIVKLHGCRSGPAYARNRGVELARGQAIAFVDGDVVVRPDTLPRMLAALAERDDIDAVSASHADSSGAKNFVSSVLEPAASFRRTKSFRPLCPVRAGMRRSAPKGFSLGGNVR
jgi:glycosyltransferase involved in cell wall biosynthesis